MRKGIRASALLVLPLFLAPSLAQEEPQDSGVTERVEVRLVQMSILARDRKGRPVTDLTEDEIVVKERGQRRKLAFLEPLRKPKYDEPPPNVRLHVAAPGGWEGEPLAAEVEPSYLILFIDVEHDQRLKKPDAIRDAIRFLNEDLDPNYRVAVFSYDGEINQETGFTTDRVALGDAVRLAYDRPPRPSLDLFGRMRGLISRLDDCVIDSGAFIKYGDEQCIETVVLEYADERRPSAEDYVDALDGLVRYAAGLRGRKTILALSHGIAENPADEAIQAARAVFGVSEVLARVQLAVGFAEGVELKMDRLTDMAIRHRVTLHFVDRNLPPSADFSARLGLDFQPGARPLQAAFEAPQWDLEELATHTGGIFVGSPGELHAGLKKAMDVEQGGYFLGYYVDAYRSREELAKVKVNCTRGGVKISHRRGYYDQGGSGTIVGRIDLGKRRQVTAEGRQGQFVPFRVQADPYVLGYEVSQHVAEAHFTLHFLVRGEDGRLLADSFHFISHGYPREIWEANEAEPVTLQGWVEAPVGRYTLVAYLHNSRTGRDGELTRELVVDGAQQ